jgi:hypothetical protein
MSTTNQQTTVEPANSETLGVSTFVDTLLAHGHEGVGEQVSAFAQSTTQVNSGGSQGSAVNEKVQALLIEGHHGIGQEVSGFASTQHNPDPSHSELTGATVESAKPTSDLADGVSLHSDDHASTQANNAVLSLHGFNQEDQTVGEQGSPQTLGQILSNQADGYRFDCEHCASNDFSQVEAFLGDLKAAIQDYFDQHQVGLSEFWSEIERGLVGASSNQDSIGANVTSHSHQHEWLV